jgi:hypothetical protein
MAALVALIQASWLDRIETAATRAALAEARARANDRLIEAQAAEVELLREIRAVQDAEPMEPGPIATTPLVASPVAQGRAQPTATSTVVTGSAGAHQLGVSPAETAVVTIDLDRVTHCGPDGPVRELLQTALRTSAAVGARTWMSRLGQQQAGGEVAIVALRTGETTAVYPVAGPANDE